MKKIIRNKKGQIISFKNYLIYFLLAGVFIVSMYAFAQQLGSKYGSTDLTVDSEKINLVGLESSINDTTDQAQSWQRSFTNDNPFVATGSLILFSLFGIMKLMWGSVTSIITILLAGMYNILGVPPIVGGVIVTGLIIGLIFAAWRVIKGGE